LSSPSHLQSPISSSVPSASFNRIMHTPQGTFRLLGQREGDWFRAWQPTILRAVLMRYISLTPLTSPTSGGGGDVPGGSLDGYWDTGVASAAAARGHIGPAFPMTPGSMGFGVGGPVTGGAGLGVGGGLGAGTGVGTGDGRIYLP
jgi:hypothetical protein